MCRARLLFSEQVSGAREGRGAFSSHVEDSGPAELSVPDPATLESSVPPAL